MQDFLEAHVWFSFRLVPDIFNNNECSLSLDNKYKSGKLAREWSKVKRFHSARKQTIRKNWIQIYGQLSED